MYLHERENWTDFRWDNTQVSLLLDDVCREQGRLLGRLAGIMGDIFLSRGDHGCMRFYSVNQGINRDKKRCYDIRERILPLDAARFAQGELPLAHLLMKYCAYLCC